MQSQFKMGAIAGFAVNVYSGSPWVGVVAALGFGAWRARRQAGLRAPALRGDLTRWAEAWVQLEQDEITPLLEAAEGGAAVRLTLCGERSAISWASGLPAKPGALSRLRGLFQRQRPLDLTQLLSQL